MCPGPREERDSPFGIELDRKPGCTRADEGTRIRHRLALIGINHGLLVVTMSAEGVFPNVEKHLEVNQ